MKMTDEAEKSALLKCGFFCILVIGSNDLGGLKEKILGAKSAGIKLVLVPFKNKKDIDDLEKEILDGISVKYVQHAEEVFREVLV